MNLACRQVGNHLLLYSRYSLFLFQKDYVNFLIHPLLPLLFLSLIILIHEYRYEFLIQRVEEFHIVRFKLKVKHLTVLLNPSLMYSFWNHYDIMLQLQRIQNCDGVLSYFFAISTTLGWLSSLCLWSMGYKPQAGCCCSYRTLIALLGIRRDEILLGLLQV